MLKELVGKEVVMYVSFMNGSVHGGSTPAQLKGSIIDVSDTFVKMDVSDSTVDGDFKVFSNSYRTGKCIINIQYIISVFELK